MIYSMPEPAPHDATQDVDRVGVIGLGAMGRPMTEHLLRRPATTVAVPGAAALRGSGPGVRGSPPKERAADSPPGP